jgi:hypothetical protein
MLTSFANSAFLFPFSGAIRANQMKLTKHIDLSISKKEVAVAVTASVLLLAFVADKILNK